MAQPHLEKAKRIVHEMGDDLTSGTRVLFLIHRNKEGGHTNNTKLAKVIVHTQATYVQELAKLLAMQEQELKDTGTYIRIYASVNARNLDKAKWTFKQRQLDVQRQGKEREEHFYKYVNSEMVSALMLPANAATSYFILDIDNKNVHGVKVEPDIYEIVGRLAENQKTYGRSDKPIEVLKTYKTPNGYHIVTTPFNPALLITIPEITLVRDGLILLR